MALASLRRRGLYDRSCCSKDVLAHARAGRIDALAVDQPLGMFCLVTLRNKMPVPTFRVYGAPWAKVENGRVPVDTQRQHLTAQQIANGIVAGITPHRPGGLAGR